MSPELNPIEFLMNKYAAPMGGAVEQACLAMGTIPGPNDWEIPTHGDQWERCAFFIGISQYDASAAETIAGHEDRTYPLVYEQNWQRHVWHSERFRIGVFLAVQVLRIKIFY
jgi:hypothetical protein